MAKKKTALQLVNFVKSKLGTNYVYGAKGQVLTASVYNALKNRYGSLVWDSDRSKIGTECVDCSGLISWCTGIIRNSLGYNQTATEVLPISEIKNAKKGYAVYKKGHIGVYIGNNEVIEAKGSKYGVVKTHITAGNWTCFLKLKDIDYEGSIKTKYYKKCNYNGVSIVDALKSINVDSSFYNRKKIAHANGINTYSGTASQNLELLRKLKEGKLICAT